MPPRVTRNVVEAIMANITQRSVGALIAAALLCIFSLAASAKDDYRIAWSIYVGWMPWGYAQESGIVDKWAEKIRHHHRGGAIQRLHRVHQPVHGGVRSTAAP